MSDGAEDSHSGWEAVFYDGGEDDREPDRPPDPGIWPPPPTSPLPWFGTAPTCWWDWIPLVLLALPLLAVVLAAALAAALVASPIAWVRRKVRGPLRRRRRRAKERRAGVEGL